MLAPVFFVGVRGIRTVAKKIERLPQEPEKYQKLWLGHLVRMQEEIGTGGDQGRQLASQCVKQCRRPSEQGCAQIAAFLREIADREEKLWRGLLHMAK